MNRPLGSSAKDANAAADSCTSGATGTTPARATYRSRSIGCISAAYAAGTTCSTAAHAHKTTAAAVSRASHGSGCPHSGDAAAIHSARVASGVMTTASPDLELAPLDSRPRPLQEWLTTFPLAAVMLDPYTNESSWILHTARRILVNYSGAGCRACWVLACGDDDAKRFLGPYAQELLTFADPRRRAPDAFGVTTLPAFALILQDGSVAASAQGWDPSQWRTVAEAVSDLTEWKRPIIGDGQDPPAFAGTPAHP